MEEGKGDHSGIPPLATRGWARIADQAQATVKVIHVTPQKAEVHFLGGFPYEAYGLSGVISPLGINRLIEYSRLILMRPQVDTKSSWIDLDILMGKILLFIAGTKSRIEPEIYDPNLAKGPIRLTQELIHVGKTSKTTLAKIYLPGIPEPVVENTLVMVCIDPATRKPSAFPDWWLRKFVTPEILYKPPVRFEKVTLNDVNDVMSKAYHYSLTVSPSDCDCNLHANFSSYLRFCLDAYNTSLIAGPQGVKELGMDANNVREYFVSYKAESLIGEKLDITFQKSPADKDVLNFIVLSSATKKPACECRMKFFSKSVGASL